MRIDENLKNVFLNLSLDLKEYVSNFLCISTYINACLKDEIKISSYLYTVLH